MSTLLMDENIFSSKYQPNHSRGHILKSKENVSKLKCNRSLKKKLKKYKLRKDGQEDPDIIDVSQSLINSLRIKSPNNPQLNSYKGCEENRPHNYLTKMVRLKKAITVVEPTPANVETCSDELIDESISLTPKIDQDKKQTDAFKVLMESRNKSIGTNSPGKAKIEENSVDQEKTEKKELRAKRILSLNRMAQAKGSLKKLEIEEYREEHIKRKMEDRARKFKQMIVGDPETIEKRDPVTSSSKEKVQISSIKNTSDRDSLNISSPILKTFDLFKDTRVKVHSDDKKISKEDEEFLKKLSPSIRKKENMLCYFQKVNKESDSSQDDGDTSCSQNNQLIIKVKLKSSNNKAAQKKKKHITSKAMKESENHEHDVEAKIQSQSSTADTNDNIKKRKHNKNINLEREDITNKDINGTIQCHKDRPRRNTKKPIKYADDVQLSTSDEELHIFTPKKKRKEKVGCERTLKPMLDNTKDLVIVENYDTKEKSAKIKQKKCKDIKKKSPNSEVHSNAISKKATKLAPIFVPKPLLDSAAIEAKQKFLQSGVPSQLKKTSMNQMNMLISNEFQKVVHVQQQSNIDTPSSSKILNLTTENYDEEINLKETMDMFKKLLQVPISQNYIMPKYRNNINHTLQYIKQTYPKFPVYRTYHLLRGKSKGEFKDCIYPDLDNSVEIFNSIVDIHNVQPDKLNWIDKYKPTTEKQMIGNFESIRELKRWLVTWTENDAKTKKKKDCGSDLSDFYQSDTDSREVAKNENNLLIITGKVGTGKTLSVYAVASELAMKVIEVNASTKRTGKIMLQDLQEATQSHKVNRGKNSTDSAQKQETCTTKNLLTVAKKRGRKKKVKVDSVNNPLNSKDSMELPVTQENARTGMSLILIDDADIVFEQDDGFCNAISQLIQSSKRPVILVATSLSCPHLQKFLGLAKIIKMRPFLPRMLGTWLDIMCLVDNNTCSPGLGAKVLDIFRGDIRKSINYLQFYMASHKHLNNIDTASEEVLKANADDENSCMSWGDSEGWGDKNMGLSNSNEGRKFEQFENLEDLQLLQFLSPLNNFYFWWNLPNLLNYSQKDSERNFEKVSKTDKTSETMELNRISHVLDTMSITDYLGNMNAEPNITSGPWQSFETESVIDSENFATYDRSNESINEFSWELMIREIAAAQTDVEAKNKTEINYPSMAIQRERDRVASRHRTLTNCLNPSTVLDRRALALDYWSSCRTICRAEKNKTNNNNKRNNRFCHYLKSLNLVCKNEYFDNLAESLCFKK